MINDFGIQNFNNRNIARHTHLLEKYFPNIITLKLLLALVYFVIVLLFAWLSGYEADYFQLLLWLLFNQILISMIYFLRSNISGLAMYRVDSLLSVLDKLLLIIICGVLLYSSLSANFEIMWFVYAQTLSLFLTAVVAFFIVNGKLRSFQLKFNYKFLLLILKESYPYALIGLLMTIYTRIDAVMLERLLDDGKTEAGIYASAYRLLDASNMLGFMFAGLLLPMFSRMIKNNESITALLRFSFQLIWMGSLALAMATYCYRIEIMEFLYDEAMPYWGEILGHLMWTFVAVSIVFIVGALLTANGNLRALNIIFFIGVILNVALNLWLIPTYKAMGAVVATLVTQYFVTLALVAILFRAFKLSLNVSYSLSLVGFTLFYLATAIGIQSYLNFEWLPLFFMTLIAAIPFAFLFGLIDVKALLGLLKSERS